MKALLINFLLLFLAAKATAQGRVVINEYMPWTGNGCGVTSEFIELLNFGPGPVNIGCYILTEGDFSITIPPNTILQPGQFYVISGQSFIAAGCANIEQPTTVNLNWNNCNNCTSATIPTTGDGLFTDGGAASEQLVLLDPNLRVVDAVVRDISLREPSSTITTAAVGGCTPRTFNLDQMTLQYEMIGESAGRANSFARKVDGDCAWVKDSRQSAGASNNTAGETSTINYTLNFVRSRDCDSLLRGAVSITVQGTNINAAFPITYTLIYDADSNQVFDITDPFVTGTDATAPNVELDQLAVGRYRVSVGSALGCNLKTFDFEILRCEGMLPVQLRFFRHTGTAGGFHRFAFSLADAGLLTEVVLEQSTDGRRFTPAASLNTGIFSNHTDYTLQAAQSGHRFFRLLLRSREGSLLYSPVISTQTGVVIPTAKIWPNPTRGTLQVSLDNPASLMPAYTLYHSNGTIVRQGLLHIDAATGTAKIETALLAPGLYQMAIQAGAGKQPIILRFVKQ